jgi:hypothetical protein
MPAQSSTKLAGATFAVTEVLLGSGEAVDLNGEAKGLIIDADADTSISAPTDDQIDIEISGADDFRFTANKFTSLSGSVIETNAINETTAASGVVIDGVLVKDTAVAGRTPVLAKSANGAVTVPVFNQIYPITKAGVCALTIVDPTATTHDGVELTFIATTANAHTLDNSAGSGFFSSGGASKDVATFGGAIGDYIRLVAYQGAWYIQGTLNITLG